MRRRNGNPRPGRGRARWVALRLGLTEARAVSLLLTEALGLPDRAEDVLLSARIPLGAAAAANRKVLTAIIEARTRGLR